MKKAIILLVVVLLLCGCVSLRELLYPKKPTLASTTSTSTSTSSTSSSSTSSSLPATCLCCTLWGDAWDECIYDAAIEKRNFSLCDRIEGKLSGTLCLAAKKKDAKICDLINGTDGGDKCYYGVAITKNDESVCGRIGLQMLKDSCYLRISRTKGDKRICDKIGFATIQDICRGNCRIREVSSDMIGSVNRADFINMTVAAEGCEGELLRIAFDLRYLSLLDQSKTRFNLSDDEASFRLKCIKDTNETLIRLKVGDKEIVKKAACGPAKPPEGCTLSPLADESSLDAIVGRPVYLAVSARNCKDKEVSYYLKPEYLRFSSWSFNGVVRGNRSNRTKTDDETIVLSFVCNRSYDGILLRTTVGDKKLVSYVVCRDKPECRLRVSEDDSLLDAAVGGEVWLTVNAVDCRYDEVRYSAEPGWLTWVNTSRTNISEGVEKIRIRYLCRKASDYLLFISIEAGEDEALGYARCAP
jgi:uncharacterized protein YceK